MPPCSVGSDRLDEVFATLAYVDVDSHGRHATAPRPEKDSAVHPFNGHEGGGPRHLKAKLAFLAAHHA